MGPSCSTNIHTDSHFWAHGEPEKLIFMSKTQNKLFMINLISPSVHIGRECKKQKQPNGTLKIFNHFGNLFRQTALLLGKDKIKEIHYTSNVDNFSPY